MKDFRFRFAALMVLAVGIMLLGAIDGSAQQASLVLENSNAELCHRNDTAWTVTKSVAPTGTVEDGAALTFTINVTRGATTNNTLCVDGYVSIRNGGTNTAYIGNIVVNLQKRVGNNWVSAGADVATASAGDAATTAKIVASQSQENTNFYNYEKSNPAGTFAETTASGPLSFTDVDNNTVFSISPTFNLGANQVKNLLFQAEFNNSIMGLTAGSQVRAEVLVTFGGAGARGGGNASASNIDVNGNGSIDAEEANVRTVATRITKTVPPLQACNDTVTLTDAITTTATASFSQSGSTLPAGPISGGGTYTIDGIAHASDLTGGTIINTATITGASSSVTVNGPIDPLTGQPIYSYTFPCCTGVSAQAVASVDVIKKPDEQLKNGDFCSFSQGAFGGSGAPYNLLSANFGTIYPSGVEVGIPGAGGFSMTFSTALAVQSYLPAGGGANKLNADLINPASSSSGQFGGQTLALKLNIALSDGGATNTGFGDLYYCDAPNSLNGLTVRQILAAAETALGGGALPAGYDYATLAGLAANLDLSFDGKVEPTYPTCGVASAWALQHLMKSACQ